MPSFTTPREGSTGTSCRRNHISNCQSACGCHLLFCSKNHLNHKFMTSIFLRQWSFNNFLWFMSWVNFYCFSFLFFFSSFFFSLFLRQCWHTLCLLFVSVFLLTYLKYFLGSPGFSRGPPIPPRYSYRNTFLSFLRGSLTWVPVSFSGTARQRADWSAYFLNLNLHPIGLFVEGQLLLK